LLRGAGFITFIAIFLVFYKGYRSIYADDDWSISGFLKRFIEMPDDEEGD